MKQTLHLSTTDHLIIAIHAMFIFLGLKLAFSSHFFLSFFGFILAYLNLKSFDTYSLWRKNSAGQR